MSANADTATRFLQAAIAGNPDYDALAPDAIWWVPGRPDMPMVPFLEGLTKIFPKGGKLEILGVTAEGDRVAIEAASSIDFPDGRNYSNLYHFLVTLDGGKVKAVKEYCDTALVHAFFGG